MLARGGRYFLVPGQLLGATVNRPVNIFCDVLLLASTGFNPPTSNYHSYSPPYFRYKVPD